MRPPSPPPSSGGPRRPRKPTSSPSSRCDEPLPILPRRSPGRRSPPATKPPATEPSGNEEEHLPLTDLDDEEGVDQHHEADEDASDIWAAPESREEPDELDEDGDEVEDDVEHDVDESEANAPLPPPTLNPALLDDGPRLLRVIRRVAGRTLGALPSETSPHRLTLAGDIQALRNQLNKPQEGAFLRLVSLWERVQDHEELDLVRWAYDQGRKNRPDSL